MNVALRFLVLSLAAAIAGPALAATNDTQTIVIKGSNTFGEELGPQLIKAYTRLHPEVAIQLEAKGSASGFAALLAGECDIAAASRPANEDELRLARSRRITLSHYVIGYYGVAVIVHATNLVRALTDQQIADVFAGSITNWKQLGGPNARIQTYIRDAVSGTHIGFQELAMNSRPYATGAKALLSYREIVDAVAADPTGIGYVGINVLLPANAQPMRVNREWPTATSVNEGAYPYARQLRLYVNADKLSPAAKEFVQFVLARPGQQILDYLGFVHAIEAPIWPPPAAP